MENGCASERLIANVMSTREGEKAGSAAYPLGIGQATPVIGGIFRRSAHQFDGQIDGVRISSGLLTDDALTSDPARWSAAGAVVWDAKRSGAPGFEWTGGTGVAESTDPRARAMADLCHVLLNSNEFVYLH